MKKCPYCAEEIQDEAIKCRFCGSMLLGQSLPTTEGSVGDDALQFTHSGRRFLLGYGRDFFGIWDRQGGSAPISRFPRSDEGWQEAWLAFSAQEPESAEVGFGVAAAPTSSAGLYASPEGTERPGTLSPRRVGGAWWLLPILAGWLGGLIAWLLVKDQDPAKARAMLWTGIAISALLVLLLVSQQPT